MRNLHPFLAQAGRAGATLALVPAAAHTWPTVFTGTFFLCVSVGYFASLFLDQGFSSSGYYLVASRDEGQRAQVLRSILSRRLFNAGLALAPTIAASLLLPQYAVLIFATALYATSLALSFSFHFNLSRLGGRFVLSECVPPICLLLAPIATWTGLPPEHAFLLSGAAAASAMAILALHTAGPPRWSALLIAKPAWSVAFARMVTYGFTMITAPVATLLYGASATASIALADRSNGFIGLLIVPLGATLAGETARAGADVSRAARVVLLTALGFAIGWGVYAAALSLFFPHLAPIIFGAHTSVPLALVLTFAVASLLSGFNTFMVAGFLTPRGRFNSTLSCAAVGAASFAASVLALNKLGPTSVPLARVISEGSVCLVAAVLFFRTLRQREQEPS